MAYELTRSKVVRIRPKVILVQAEYLDVDTKTKVRVSMAFDRDQQTPAAFRAALKAKIQAKMDAEKAKYASAEETQDRTLQDTVRVHLEAIASELT